MATEYLRRTAITRLRVSDVQAELLDRTIEEWRSGATVAAEIGWEHGETRRTKLQSLAYDEVRDQTSLGSQHAILATHQAAQAIDTVRSQADLGKNVSIPTFTSPTVPYDGRTLTLFDDGEVSLTTIEDRIRCELALPDSEGGYQYRYLDSDSWELTESTLTARNSDYFLHLGFKKPKPETETTGNRTVLGVDLGIEQIAVTSTGRFESGRELRHNHDEFERVRKRLQKTGTQSAHRTLERRAGREERHLKNELHQVANAIIKEALEHGVTDIAFENLTHIGKNLPDSQKFHKWAHRRLVKFVKYRAASHGIEVTMVNPSDTSRRCSECGHVVEQNRPERHRFECVSCGKRLHADYNAAKNVGWRLVRRGQTDSRRTGQRRLALKSGVVRPNQGFAPYSAVETEVEPTDEPGSSEVNPTG